MHEISKAFSDWRETDEGKTCEDLGILSSDGYLKYLQNRIYHAFHAGARAQEKINSSLNQEIDQVGDLGYGLKTVLLKGKGTSWRRDPGYLFYAANKNRI